MSLGLLTSSSSPLVRETSTLIISNPDVHIGKCVQLCESTEAAARDLREDPRELDSEAGPRVTQFS